MSVFITLVNGDSSGQAGRDTSDVAYEDIAKEVGFSYDLHASGALRVMRNPVGHAPSVECVFGPGVWFRVRGAWFSGGGAGGAGAPGASGAVVTPGAVGAPGSVGAPGGVGSMGGRGR